MTRIRSFFRSSFTMAILTPLILTLALMPARATSTKKKTIRITTCNWQPYAGVNLTNFGFTTEIVTTAFQRLGYKVQSDILPWKRAMVLTDSGEYDVLFNTYYSAERAKRYAFSDPYVYSMVYLCTKKGKDITYSRLEDLKPYSIGVVAGFVNSKEFDRADYLKKDIAPSDLHNLKKLVGNRIDLIVIDKYVGIHLIKTSPFIVDSILNFTFLEPPLVKNPVHAAFSKAVPGYEKRLEQFNNELKRMRKDGTYSMILQKYDFE